MSRCKSLFWGLVMLFAVSLTRDVSVLGLPAVFIPLRQLGLFHPPVPAWRTSSCPLSVTWWTELLRCHSALSPAGPRPSSPPYAWTCRAAAYTLNLRSLFALKFPFSTPRSSTWQPGTVPHDCGHRWEPPQSLLIVSIVLKVEPCDSCGQGWWHRFRLMESVRGGGARGNGPERCLIRWSLLHN